MYGENVFRVLGLSYSRKELFYKKPAVIERKELRYPLNMHIFRESLLEGIHIVALGCSREK